MSLIKQHLDHYLSNLQKIEELQFLISKSQEWLKKNLIFEIQKEIYQKIEQKFPEIEIHIANLYEPSYDRNKIVISGARIKNSVDLLVIDNSWYEEKYPCYQHNAKKINLNFSPQDVLNFCQEICAHHGLEIFYADYLELGFQDQNMIRSQKPYCADDLIVLYPEAEILFSAIEQNEDLVPFIQHYIVLKNENDILSFWTDTVSNWDDPDAEDFESQMLSEKGLPGMLKIKNSIQSKQEIKKIENLIQKLNL